MTEGGLRERKKAKTRALIINVAERLFLKHGYEAVTLEQVAHKCEVSVRTVQRYFDSKEALALANQYDVFEGFRDGLATRDVDVITYWRSHVQRAASLTAADPERYRLHAARVLSSSALAGRAAALRTEYETVMASALAEESGDRGIGPQLLAAALVAGNFAAARHWLAGREAYDPELFVRVVDHVAGAFTGTAPRARAPKRRR